MAIYPNPTTGLGVAAAIALDSNIYSLSLGGVNTHQTVASVNDKAGAPDPGTAYVLSAVATASAGVAVYTGTITGGGSNAFVGREFVVAGFSTGANNGTFLCTASSATTLTLQNGVAAAETKAATATSEGSSALTFVSYNANIATVSATGLVTGVSKGAATIEVSYPAFGNAVGNVASAGNIMNGLPLVKIYRTIRVQVTA